ncbi:UDP-3-O-(3-hydroxymyristoyl)glucosamine N-acyltransferase [Pseudomonadota bacterium]
MDLTLEQLAGELGCELHGDPQCRVSGVATLLNAKPGELSFLANSRYGRYLANTQASIVILKEEDRAACPVNVLVCRNPYLAYAKAAALLNPVVVADAGVHPTAVVEEGAQVSPTASVGAHCFVGANSIIGAGAVLGPGCVVEAGVSIGENSRFVARATVCHGVSVGNNCLVHPGVVIGADGFGIANDKGAWTKVPQVGGVVVGDDVEIGANTTIDRGALDDTVIEDGVKLDNQIQVAHNVCIGAHTAVAGCTGIAGSAKIGKRCQIGGGVVVLGHLEIADDVHITAMSLVTGNIKKPGVYSSGVPVEDRGDWNRNIARLRQLNDLAKRLRTVEKQLEDK